MRERKNDGYVGKIKYWTTKYNEAFKNGDPVALMEIMNKLNYFTGKHVIWLAENK